jgi:hypothetical protein
MPHLTRQTDARYRWRDNTLAANPNPRFAEVDLQLAVGRRLEPNASP